MDDKYLQDISQDVKIIIDKVHKIDLETTKNTIVLKEHQRRALANEALVAEARERVNTLEGRIFKEKLLNGAVITAVIAIAEILRRLI